MSNLQLWGGGLTFVGLCPVLTSGAIIDEADTTHTPHTPCWGRVFRISTQQIHLLHPSFGVMLWIVTATWHWSVQCFPLYMPTGKRNGRVSLWSFLLENKTWLLQAIRIPFLNILFSKEISSDTGGSGLGVKGELVGITVMVVGWPGHLLLFILFFEAMWPRRQDSSFWLHMYLISNLSIALADQAWTRW